MWSRTLKSSTALKLKFVECQIFMVRNEHIVPLMYQIMILF